MNEFLRTFEPPPYEPPRWLAGGHRMTVYAWARRRVFPALPRPEDRIFDVGPETRVLARCHWQADRAAHPTLLVLHGLEGSANAPYARGLADKAWRRQFNVVRLNQRNCGHTEHLSASLYHSGLSADPAAVIAELCQRDHLPSIGVVGYSLGGNLALKLAGEYGDDPPPALKAIVAVSPAMDLVTCIDALERRSNRLYELNFLVDLKRRIGRKAELYPGRYDTEGLDGIRTIRAFDDRYTAPSFGFGDAATYYYQASAKRVLDRIRVPSLILTSEDDPFVPPGSFRDPEVVSNPAIRAIICRRGGHCGFVARRARGADGDTNGYWAEATAVEFVEGLTRPA